MISQRSDKVANAMGGGPMYIECKLDRMCAFLSERWLESQGITEEDAPILTLADRESDDCRAIDLGELKGLEGDHFWLWCSREFTAEEEATHEDEGSYKSNTHRQNPI